MFGPKSMSPYFGSVRTPWPQGPISSFCQRRAWSERDSFRMLTKFEIVSCVRSSYQPVRWNDGTSISAYFSWMLIAFQKSS